MINKKYFLMKYSEFLFFFYLSDIRTKSRRHTLIKIIELKTYILFSDFIFQVNYFNYLKTSKCILFLFIILLYSCYIFKSVNIYKHIVIIYTIK